MQRSVCAIVVTLGAASWALGDDPSKSPAPTTEPPAPVANTPTPAPTDKPASSAPTVSPVVVHVGQHAVDSTDARVQVGVVRISMAGWASPPVASAPAPTEAPPVRTEAPIEVPANTLGPGEPLWRVNARQDADRKLAEAQVDLEKARAERAERSASSDHTSGGFGWSVFSPVWGRRHNGLRGPVTTTITRFDDLGSTAQHAFSDAAYPRLNGSTDAHDRAVIQFGQNATPPIVRIQNDVDRAHSNASKEHPTPPR